MKKIVFVLTVMLSVSMMFTSCKESKKGEVEHESHEGHDHDKSSTDVSKEIAYQCPMDCEKGKSYGAKGSCPVCKMDLKEKSSSLKSNHAADCKCKEGGECKCEPGKCECQKETACSKCEPGKCECKKDVALKPSCSSKKSCNSKMSSCKDKDELPRLAKECSHCEPGSCECKA